LRNRGERSRGGRSDPAYTRQWTTQARDDDPQEMRNVINDPNYLQIKAELLKKLGSLRAKYQDSDSSANAILKEDLRQLGIEPAAEAHGRSAEPK
jgi:hypothetical protein